MFRKALLGSTKRLFATFAKTSGMVPLERKNKNIFSFGQYEHYTSDGMEQSVLAKSIAVTNSNDDYLGVRKNISVTNKNAKTSVFMALYPEFDPDPEQRSYIKLEVDGKKEKTFFSKGNNLELAREIACFFKPLTPNKPHMELIKNLCLEMTEPAANLDKVLEQEGHKIGSRHKGP